MFKLRKVIEMEAIVDSTVSQKMFYLLVLQFPIRTEKINFLLEKVKEEFRSIFGDNLLTLHSL